MSLRANSAEELVTIATASCRSFHLALSALQGVCHAHTDNCRYFVLTNKFSPIVDLVMQYITPGSSALCGPLLGLLATVLSTLLQAGREQSLHQPIADTIRLG